MSSVMMSKAMNAFSAEVIRACASKYGFDGEEAMRELSVCVGAEGKKSKAKKEAAPKAAPRAIPSIPLPFTGVVREDCCLGVKQNHGLYTQCFSAAGETGLCKGCAKQASKNASGEPDCGLIAKRVMQGSEYRDAKGRAPVHYTKVMKKQKLTEEQVQTEASKFGIEIEASHFAAPETKRGRPKKATTSDTESETSSSAADATGEKKARGRPKKAAKVVEVSATEDLFASLMQQAQSASPRPSASLSAANAGGGAAADEMSDVSSNSGSESDSESKGSKKKAKKSKEVSEEELAEKAAKFLAKEEEKEKKAAAKKEQAQQEKVKKAAEKEAAKIAKEQEKEAAKIAKEQEKEAAKIAKEQEKEAAKIAKEQEKALAQQDKPKAAKKEKASKKKAEEPVKPVEPVADLESEAESEEEPVVTVKKFEHEGVTYLKSSDGVLYDAKTQSVVGKWNETTKSIDVYDGESEEEDSDSDSDEE
jgi:hypothetical protein